MSRKPRPLPLAIQVRPRRKSFTPMLCYYSGDRLVFKESRTLYLPKHPVNPEHKTITIPTNAGSLEYYEIFLAICGCTDIRRLPMPRKPFGTGPYPVKIRSHATGIWYEIIRVHDLKAAFEFAQAICTYSGYRAIAEG